MTTYPEEVSLPLSLCLASKGGETIAKPSLCLSNATSEIIKHQIANPALYRGQHPVNAMVLNAREWRYLPDPVKLILYVAALEARHGPSWAVSANFDVEMEDRLRWSDKAPVTFLKERFQKEFGYTVPRVGLVEMPGKKKDKGCLHVHMLLPVHLFPHEDALKERLYKIFGRIGKGSHQIQVIPTQTVRPFRGLKDCGFTIGGGAGFLLYSTKHASRTRNDLELTRRKRPKASAKPMTGEEHYVRLLRALGMVDIKLPDGKRAQLKPYRFYFDDMVFKTGEVGTLARQFWSECHWQFVEEAYANMIADKAVANENAAIAVAPSKPVANLANTTEGAATETLNQWLNPDSVYFKSTSLRRCEGDRDQEATSSWRKDLGSLYTATTGRL